MKEKVSSGFFLKTATADDMQIVHDMAEVVFRHTYENILTSEQIDYMIDWMYSIESLNKQLDEGHAYHIAFAGTVPCGYMSVRKEGRDEAGVEVYHLEKIYVMPQYHGKGLGRLLFNLALEYVTDSLSSDDKSSSARIELNVNRNNPSLDFYLHMGMKIIRQGDFPIGNGFYMNDYIMGLDLPLQESNS